MAEHAPMEDTGLEHTMQKKLDGKEEELAKLRMQLEAATHRIAKVEAEELNVIKSHQPTVIDFIKAQIMSNPEHKHIPEVLSWAENMHLSKMPGAEKPLTELLVCASVGIKRGIDATAANGELESALQSKCSEFDKLNTECDGLKKRCLELEQLCMSSQNQKEALIRKSIESSSHNFSAKSSREADGSTSMGTNANPLNRVEEEGFLDWIHKTGAGGAKMYQHPVSAHAIYGSSGDAGSSNASMSLGERIRAGM